MDRVDRMELISDSLLAELKLSVVFVDEELEVEVSREVEVPLLLLLL